MGAPTTGNEALDLSALFAAVVAIGRVLESVGKVLHKRMADDPRMKLVKLPEETRLLREIAGEMGEMRADMAVMKARAIAGERRRDGE